MTVLNQPPNLSRSSGPPPDWRRPRGVAPGTWAYTNERVIADRYDAFVADTPLCETDQSILSSLFPPCDSVSAPRIVDLGCGSGRTAVELSARGYAVVGVDLSQSMLENLAQKSAHRLPIATVRANLVELDCFADNSFDHAVCMFSTLGMIQGRQHRRQMLSHVCRMVVSGGHFVVHVHHRWAALGEHGGTRQLARSWWRSLRSPEHEFGDATYGYRGIADMFMHRFSRKELLSDLRATGWSIERIDYLSQDGSQVTQWPKIMRHRIGGFIVTAKNAKEASV